MKNVDREEFWKQKFENAAKEFEDDSIISLWSEHSLYRRIETFLEILKGTNIRKGGLLLDIGCGPGTYSIILNDMGYKVLGVDYSFSMIAKAVKKSKGRNINYQVASLYSLPFRDDSFDAIICMGVFQFVTNDMDAIKEIRRVMKNDNGTLFLSAPNALSIRFFYGRIIKILREILSLKKIENIAGINTKRYHPFHLKKILNMHGITKVTIYGIYVFPNFLLPVESLLKKFRIFQLMDKFPYLQLLFAHDFLLKASITK